MSNDEFDRKMEFIVEQQAQFAVDIQRLTERQERFQVDLERLTDRVDALADKVETLTDRVDALTDRVDALTAAVESTRETVAAVVTVSMTLVDRYKEMRDAQTETQRVVDQLARIVFHHVSDGHGGGPVAGPAS